MLERMHELYQFHPSGNCYKVRLLLRQLGIPFRTVEVDLSPGREVAILKELPFERVPALRLGDGRWLAESNAILLYFAEGSVFLPEDRYERAKVLEWLFWEQYDHEPYIAVARAWKKFFGIPEGREAELAMRMQRGEQALARLEKQLSIQEFLAGNHYTIADIALFAYTHVAEDGGFTLARYPAVQAWIGRVKAQPRFVSLEEK